MITQCWLQNSYTESILLPVSLKLKSVCILYMVHIFFIFFSFLSSGDTRNSYNCEWGNKKACHQLTYIWHQPDQTSSWKPWTLVYHSIYPSSTQPLWFPTVSLLWHTRYMGTEQHTLYSSLHLPSSCLKLHLTLHDILENNRWAASWPKQHNDCIHPVWSGSSLCAQWEAKDQSFLHADSEDFWSHFVFMLFIYKAVLLYHYIINTPEWTNAIT